MRAYAQVVDSCSYTKAAQLLNLHKATVSDQIQQLEERLGSRLLTRTTRSVTPTAEGLAYYQRACAILQLIDETEAMLRKASGSPAGPLRVEVPVALGRLVVVPEIRSFLDRYPKITLELGCTDRVVDVIKEGVDCALRGGDHWLQSTGDPAPPAAAAHGASAFSTRSKLRLWPDLAIA